MTRLSEAIQDKDDEVLLQVIRGMKPALQEKMMLFLKNKHPEIYTRLEKAQETHLENVFISMLENASIPNKSK